MRRRYPILRALAAQVLAVVLVALASFLIVNLGRLPVHWMLLVLAQAGLAVWIGKRFGLVRWWSVFQALFVSALLGLHALALPPMAYFAAFLVVLLLNWNSFRHGVPLYLTSNQATLRLAELLRERGPEFKFIDLGCGLAGPLCQLARRYPLAQFTGVETAPLTFLIAWLRALPRRNCRIRYRSLWRVSLTPYDVIYCFLSPLPMSDLWQKALVELRPGAVFISNTFGIPGVSPDEEYSLPDRRRTRLLVWKK